MELGQFHPGKKQTVWWVTNSGKFIKSYFMWDTDHLVSLSWAQGGNDLQLHQEGLRLENKEGFPDA